MSRATRIHRSSDKRFDPRPDSGLRGIALLRSPLTDVAIFEVDDEPTMDLAEDDFETSSWP